MAKDKNAFDFKEIEMEVRAIINEENTQTDENVTKIMNNSCLLINKMRGLQYFCSVVLYNNKVHLLHQKVVFPRYSDFLSRLKKAVAVVENDDYVKILITQEQCPQFPSVYLFAITWFILVRRVCTKCPYHQRLGEAWINYYRTDFAIDSPSYDSLYPTAPSQIEDNPVQTMQDTLDHFLYRLKSSEEFVTSHLEDKTTNEMTPMEIPLLSLLDEIKKIRGTPYEVREKTPLVVLGRRDLLLVLAMKTKRKDIYNEIYDACRHFDKSYQKI